ncbi:MAG: alpha-amylase family glycosyl hydrolase, partial [Clostridiaceae bacterium]
MDKKWWKEGVAYQAYVRSFKDSDGDGIGDLEGIIEKLDYLKELGIDILYLNPINKSPNDDNGYDISDFEDIMDEFGTLEDFDRLIESLHNRDMKLVMDIVINH